MYHLFWWNMSKKKVKKDLKSEDKIEHAPLPLNPPPPCPNFLPHPCPEILLVFPLLFYPWPAPTANIQILHFTLLSLGKCSSLGVGIPVDLQSLALGLQQLTEMKKFEDLWSKWRRRHLVYPFRYKEMYPSPAQGLSNCAKIVFTNARPHK